MRRWCLAVLLCVTAVVVALRYVPTAAASDEPELAWADEVSSNTAAASATNESTTSQSSTEVQVGGSSGGQSQSTVQDAATAQNAAGSATATQSGTNDHSAGTVTSNATNRSSTTQQSAQTQQAGHAAPPPPDAAPAGAQSQKVEQRAPVQQKADATATSAQVAPTNVNVVVRLDSPGDDGPVTQTNTSAATGTAGNGNVVAQTAEQGQTGGGPKAGETQQAVQTAPTAQEADATATSTQVNPLNLNVVIRNKSPGDEGPVSQANTSLANAVASNTNAVGQDASQAQTTSGSSTGQVQLVTQSAPTSQTATAAATSLYVPTADGSISVSLDPNAVDPNGSGAVGWLIEIWIPSGTPKQASSSSVTATATNSSSLSQTAQQTQQTSTQAGGSGETQTVTQTAKSTQSATATADEGSASAVQTSSIDVFQRAVQIQTGGGISSGWSYGWILVEGNGSGAAFALRPAPRSEAAPAEGGRERVPAPRPGTKRPAPERLPGTPPPAALGAASSGTSGGSLLIVAVLLLPFVLTAPWWSRRYAPSAVRRLMGVVTRLLRPG